MKKAKTQFECTNCQYVTSKWVGKCPQCNEWSTLEERAIQKTSGARGLAQVTGAIKLSDVKPESTQRIFSGNSEFDRALGGGFAQGSLTLIGGDPGIGKSTLLLQTAANMAAAGLKTLYVSGEESTEQIKMRAERLQVANSDLLLFSETDLNKVLKEGHSLKPQAMVTDSIQTVYKDDLPGTPGSVSQIRECTLDLMVFAKTTNCITVLVGHVTKDGQIAGPRVLEHMVDTVVYFEGDRNHQFRLLRTIKNRFGSTNEIGVFEMTGAGLIPVANPSMAFLQDNQDMKPGSTVSCTLEGTRSLLFEIQALVCPSTYSVAQRVPLGIDPKRITIILALLDKFGDLEIGQSDIFVSLVGGLKIEDPAIDLAIALAVASNHLNRSIDNQTLIVGELGLSGEVRQAPQLEARLAEAARLGFKKAIVPRTKKEIKIKGLEIIPVSRLTDAIEIVENL